MSKPLKLVVGNIDLEDHANEMLRLLNLYMLDPMGISAPLNATKGSQIITGLRNQSNYKLLLGYVDGACVAMANCFVNFSTFRGQQLLNIHDFIVDPACRKEGFGALFMNSIFDFAKNQGYCRVNLEVRCDNFGAQKLYRKLGFHDCNPPMLFWEHPL